jgi:RHS repeat-associated protein
MNGKAMPSGTNSQTTAYVYGTTSTGGVFSNDLLAKIEYPNASTGSASTASTDDQSYTYDKQGEKLTYTDQNGTVHDYGYDVLGRLTSDTASTLGSGIDGTIRRLGYSFNDVGLPFQQTSYYDTSGASVANQVQDAYNDYGQLIAQYQAVAGAVDTSSTPAVQYGYSQPSGANYSRQTSMTYPDGRVVDYNYNTGIDTTISRLSSMSDSGGGNIESYSYLGLSTIVREIRPGSVLTLVKASGASNGDAGDMYTGLDRFGRVVNQLWVTADTVSSGTGGDTLGTTTDQFEYGYDQDSNVLYKDNMVHSADSELYHANSTTSGDDSTAYDPLNRLATFRRGTLSSSGNNGSSLDTVTTASGTNSWSLDALGNSTSTGGTSRTFNSKNQITAYGGSVLTGYDYDGNMTYENVDIYQADQYDAWNRLVYVDMPDNPVNTTEYYSYNADNERPGLSVCNGAVTTTYYSTQWQELEEDVTVDSSTTVNTYLWSEAYIDELVARDSSVDGGSVTRIFAQQDANHDITSLTNSSGTVLERFIYDPYGQQTVLSASWASTSDSYNWVYGFQGGRLDPLTGLINFRNRDLNSTLGVWMEQDPAGYVDGADLYLFDIGDPPTFDDPYGTTAATAPAPGHLEGNGGKATIGVGTDNVTFQVNVVNTGAIYLTSGSATLSCDKCEWLQFVHRIFGNYDPAQYQNHNGDIYNSTTDPKNPIYRTDNANKGNPYATGGGLNKPPVKRTPNTPNGNMIQFKDNPSFTPAAKSEQAIYDDFFVCQGKVLYHITWEKDKTAGGGTSYTNISGDPVNPPNSLPDPFVNTLKRDGFKWPPD